MECTIAFCLLQEQVLPIFDKRGGKTIVIDHHTTRCFRVHEDILLICDRNDAQAAAIEVLSEATNTRLTFLRKTLQDAEMGHLWLSLSYHDFYKQALGIYSISTLRKALEELEKRGFVEARYVRENGALIVYRTNSEAQADKAHTGEITKQYRLRYDLVQAAIDAKFRREGSEGAHEGVPGRVSPPSDSSNSTTDPHTNTTGGY